MAKRSLVFKGLILLVLVGFGGCSVGGLALMYYKGTGGTANSVNN